MPAEDMAWQTQHSAYTVTGSHCWMMSFGMPNVSGEKPLGSWPATMRSNLTALGSSMVAPLRTWTLKSSLPAMGWMEQLSP